MDKRYSKIPFGVRLKELLANSGDAGESGKLAEFLKVSLVAIRQWTNGNNVPTVDKMLKIAEYYGVSVDWLMGARSDARTPDVAIQAVAEKYGLSELSLEVLRVLIDKSRENKEDQGEIDDDGEGFKSHELDVEYESEFGEPEWMLSSPKLAILAVNALLENEHGRNALANLGAAICGELGELYADTALFRATKELTLLQAQLLDLEG
jgi:transcriptional regulator with XRE-family HTH domain